MKRLGFASLDILQHLASSTLCIGLALLWEDYDSIDNE